MIDIFVYLFATYSDFSAHPKADALARKLSVLGFDDDEIAAALNWLAGLNSARIVEFSCDPRSLRVYCADEQRRLDVECRSFLAFLESAGVVSPAVRELIIERAMQLDDQVVPLAKLKIIVLMVLWSRQTDLEALVVEELLYAADPETRH